MIYTSVNVKINSNGTATSSNKVVLYRGDREVEIQMTLTGNPYIVKESTFAQLIIRRDNATPIITGIAPLKNSKVILTITEENIDELTEVGSYAYQIRLYDDDMSARITLPPVENGLEVREPIVDEASGAIGRAMVNYSLISRAAIDENSTFNEYDEYNKTIWRDGDYITDVKMNKIEDALYVINQRVLSNAESAYVSTDMHEDQKVGVGESLDISFEFISPNKGKGTLKVSVNGIQKMSQYVEQEELITINLPEEYFSKGDNKVTLYVVDRAGKSSNELIFMVRYGSTELTPDFDQYTAYQYGASVRYYFIPSCLDTSSKLLFHMEIDGTPKEPMECTSDVRGYYTFPNNLSVGAHHCKAYIIDAQGNRSNEVIFNLIIIDAYSIVIASDTKNPVVEEGAQLVLDYKIYMEHADTFITKVYIDDVLVSSGECGLETAYYRNSSLKEGNHIIRIEAWDKAETISDYVVWNVTVTESMFERIVPATAGAIFLASASDHSNSDQNRDKWVGVDQDGNEVVAQLENFTFDSESGWVDNELIFGGVAKAVVPIQPLANNARYGFTLDLEFTSTEIGAEGALVLDLWDYTKDCGIKITTEKLRLRSAEGNEASLYFEDSTNTSVIFVIDRNEKKAKIYLNGVMCSAFNLSDYESNGKWVLEDFTVDDYIRLGGKGASRIRNLRVYQVALTTNEIINNFISNKQSKDEQKELVEFQKGLHLPTLTIYCDFSGLGKNDKKPCKIVYSSTDEEKYGKSFELDHRESSVQYQGTSSMAYPIKNYRINLRDENGDKLYYDFPFGQPECRFTLKADFMSSGHWQNTGLTKWINDNLYNYNEKDEKSMNPKKWFDLQNGGSIDDTRECIYGFPCRLILVNDGNTPLNAGQNEPTPGNTKDMGIFNFNHDKDATDTMGFDKDNFPNCMGFEVTANSDTSAGAFMRYTGGGTQEDELEYYKQSFELRFPDEDDVEPWYGFLGINAGTMVTDFYKQGDDYSTSYWEWDIFNTALHISSDKTIKSIECYYYDELLINMAVNATDKNVTLVDGTNKIRFIFDDEPEYFYINDTKYILGNEISELSLINPYLGEEISPEYGIKRLVEWVDTCSDEEFVRDFEQYFHKDYTLRYYLLVITLGMVDNLGKNMMLDTWDGKIFMPRFYDCDTICSYDNTGDIVFDVDIEMAQGYWNTSSSRLWTRIRDLMHPELVAKYNNMRQNGLSYESLMRCFYDEQIAKIPQKYYNMDYDVKYAPFGDSYMGMAHGDGYEHLKRWLKKRILFVDSLFDYAPSYTSDMLTIRANTTETMSLTIETYDPQYVHVSWYNGQMDKIKVDGKTPVTFTGKAMAATDQEVLIYGGTNIKKLSGISTMNPGELIIGAATRLAELDASDCPILTQINLNKANLSAHPQLIKLNISNCPMLGGNLRIDNAKLLQELRIENTAISGINFPPKMRNLTILKVGNTNITSLDLSCWDTSNVTDMSNMFYNCNNLTSLDVSGFNTSNVANMHNMFSNCRGLTSLDVSGFDTSKVTNMDSMFRCCNKLTSLDLSGLDTSKVINMVNMFYDCNKLTNLDLSGWDTSAVTVMNGMFQYCAGLTSLDLSGFDTSKVTTMSNMFHNCSGLTSLDLSGWDTSKVKDMDSMFYNCNKLTNLDLSGWDTSAVTVMNGMFSNCRGLTSLDVSGFDTSKVTNMDSMFRCCNKLTSLDLSGWDTSKVINMVNMFYDCIGLTSLNVTLWPLNDTTQIAINTLPVGDDDKNDVIASEYFAVPTGWTLIYNSPYDIAIYTCNASGVLPTFNEEYTGYSVEETDNGDGTYTTCIRTNDLEVMPTKMSFDQGIYPDTRLLRVDKLSTTNIVDADCMFRNNTALDYVNLSGVKTSNVIVMSGMFAGCSNLTSLDLSSFDTSNVTNMTNMFYGCTSLTSLDVSGFKTSEVTNMNNMFANCTNLTSLDVSSFDTSNVTSMYSMFHSCNSLTSLDVSGFKTSEVTNMSNMFHSCKNLTSLDVSGFGTSKVTNMDSMFHSCKNLTSLDVSGFKTSEVTNMNNMFANCTNLTSLDVSGFDTSEVTSMQYMFYGCSGLTSLDVSGFKTSEVTNMNNMFANCTNLTSLDVSGFKTSEVTSMYSMFANCSSLTNLDVSGFDTSKVTTMSNMFYNCRGLTSLDVSGFDTSKVTNMSAMFNNCYNLTSLNVTLWPLNDITKSAISGLPVGDDVKNEIIASEYFTVPTGWMLKYSNPYDIAIYTCNASGVLPTFNEEYTGYSVEETKNNDGTYTTCIRTNDLKVMPTKISFDQGHISDTRLLRVDKLSATNIVNASYMFGNNTALEYVNLSDFDTSNITNMSYMFYRCIKLTSLDLSGFKTSNVTSMEGMFYSCSKLTSLDVSGFDTSSVTNMYYMFYGCTSLTNLDLSGFDTSEVTSMADMFEYCRKLTRLNVSGWDTSKVTTMNKMFYECNELTSLDLPGFDASDVTDMTGMFYSCSKLTRLNLSGFKTSKVAKMGSMFYNCSKLTRLDLSGFKTSNVTVMSNMFCNCYELTSLDVSGFKTSNVTNMADMFRDCRSLTSLNLSNFNTSKVTNMNNMFQNCNQLTSLDVSGWDVSKVTSMEGMFRNCQNLTNLDVSGFKTSKITNMADMFNDCRGLTSLDVSGFKTSDVTKMSNMFNNCRNLTNLDLSGWDTSKVTSMRGMFYECHNLTRLNLSGWNTSKVTEMTSIFYYCIALTTLNVMMWPLNDMTQSAINTLPSGDYENEIIASEHFSVPTGWTLVYSNPYDIAIYTCSESGVLPAFNDEYTGYSVEETDNGDGTYTTCIKTNDLEVMPTSMKFAAKTALIKVNKLKITSNITSMYYMFNNCGNLTSIEGAEDWNTSNVTDMNSMFNNCSSLTSLDLSGWNTSKVKDMQYMFNNCSSLTSLDVSGWNTSKVTSMRNMFSSCRNLTSLDLSGFDTSEVTNMYYMFRGCHSLTSLDVSGFKTHNVTSMASMFYECRGLTSLNLSNFNTSKVTTMNYMFNDCSGLTSLDLSSFDTSSVVCMNSMFYNCLGITSLNLSNFVTSKATEMRGMFNSCKNLMNLNLSSFDTSTVADMNGMFQSCSNLMNLNSMMNISTNLSLADTRLNEASLIDVINNLATVASTKSLILGTALLTKIPGPKIAAANNKGWSVS